MQEITDELVAERGTYIIMEFNLSQFHVIGTHIIQYRDTQTDRVTGR